MRIVTVQFTGLGQGSDGAQAVARRRGEPRVRSCGSELWDESRVPVRFYPFRCGRQ